ncbi:uncharacterized protein LOC124702312 isoform X2 [Lolium rigidum]|uniref:uncharacterized protein LOC124702312 isoform X2 n=1 Tax=Lolium rigidum TaxID=89674 RepID=UPI001F5C1E4F|nr:uncharacterized protein LOC124702312 isoform X2 [Lolium rigidum]
MEPYARINTLTGPTTRCAGGSLGSAISPQSGDQHVAAPGLGELGGWQPLTSGLGGQPNPGSRHVSIEYIYIVQWLWFFGQTFTNAAEVKVCPSFHDLQAPPTNYQLSAEFNKAENQRENDGC